MSSTHTFLPVSAEQTYQVPAGITSVHVTAVGGHGGTPPGASYLGKGGTPATASADLSVTPGETLHVEVGGSATYFDGGWNGGGAGGAVDGTGAASV